MSHTIPPDQHAAPRSAMKHQSQIFRKSELNARLLIQLPHPSAMKTQFPPGCSVLFVNDDDTIVVGVVLSIAIDIGPDSTRQNLCLVRQTNGTVRDWYALQTVLQYSAGCPVWIEPIQGDENESAIVCESYHAPLSTTVTYSVKTESVMRHGVQIQMLSFRPTPESADKFEQLQLYLVQEAETGKNSDETPHQIEGRQERLQMTSEPSGEDQHGKIQNQPSRGVHSEPETKIEPNDAEADYQTDVDQESAVAVMHDSTMHEATIHCKEESSSILGKRRFPVEGGNSDSLFAYYIELPDWIKINMIEEVLDVFTIGEIGCKTGCSDVSIMIPGQSCDPNCPCRESLHIRLQAYEIGHVRSAGSQIIDDVLPAAVDMNERELLRAETKAHIVSIRTCDLKRSSRSRIECAEAPSLPVLETMSLSTTPNHSTNAFLATSAADQSPPHCGLQERHQPLFPKSFAWTQSLDLWDWIGNMTHIVSKFFGLDVMCCTITNSSFDIEALKSAKKKLERTYHCKVVMVGNINAVAEKTITIHVACEEKKILCPARVAIENLLLSLVSLRARRGRMLYQWAANRKGGCSNGTLLKSRSSETTKSLRIPVKAILHVLSQEEYDYLTRDGSRQCRLLQEEGGGGLFISLGQGKDDKYVYIEGRVHEEPLVRAAYCSIMQALQTTGRSCQNEGKEDGMSIAGKNNDYIEALPTVGHLEAKGVAALPVHQTPSPEALLEQTDVSSANVTDSAESNGVQQVARVQHHLDQQLPLFPEGFRHVVGFDLWDWIRNLASIASKL
jgi:hypothetical protein